MDRVRAGLTMIEFMVVVTIIGVMLGTAALQVRPWFADAHIKSSARAAADALHMARSESVRTGSVHLAVFQQALGADAAIVVANDGPAAGMNCQVDAGETVHRVSLERGVAWGTSSAQSNGVSAPEDQGVAGTSVATGSTFTDASRLSGNTATWIAFLPDGMPRLFTPATCASLGRPGQGAGGIYLTNQRRDYAVVLSPLGAVRVHAWNGSGWTL